MRRLAQFITGSLALALMVVAQPWGLEDCPPDSCSMSSDASLGWTLFGTLLEIAVPGMILTMVLVGVLGIRDAGRASDTAVLAALGQSQRSAVRLSARQGLVDGAVATGIAFAFSAALNVYLVVKAGYGLLDSGASPLLWVVRAVMAVAFTGFLVLAHVVDAVRPHRTPVERLHEDAEAPLPRRIPLTARMLALGVILAAATGVLVSTAVAHDIANGDAGTIPTLATQAAVITIGFTCLALFFSVGVPLLRMAITPILAGAARIAGAVHATQLEALLRARAGTASGPSARTVLAIAGLALIAGAIASTDPSPSFAPTYVGTVTLQPAGLGDDLAAQYADIDGVGAVIVGTGSGFTATGVTPVVGVDPAALAGIDDALARLLTEHHGAVVTNVLWDGLSVGSLAQDGVDVSGIVPTSTCCVSVVDSNAVPLTEDGTALLIWAQPGADVVTVSNAVSSFAPDSEVVTGFGGSFVQAGATSDAGGMLFMVVLVVAVCIGPVVALAYGVTSRQRRDNATLAALGASRRSLTGAAVVETSVVAAVAVAGGLLGGALLQATITAASRARDSLGGVITDSYIEVMLRSVLWPALAWMFVIAVVAFAVMAWIVANSTRAKLPAEQLRAAETGVLS